ncbi:MULTISPECIES: hypothetical protein [unclassified Granulicatella]|uniref:hypothetical protein n=1 Tax=unclassified Granulicatella TaxID=2630493 RepID=UPI00142F62CC|nr:MULTISPECIES: hypothetical protein [unclassified Granulicatella]MBF0779575.1 hypothetical protein [Granulicatella sp. 19428wC4_WM01]
MDNNVVPLMKGVIKRVGEQKSLPTRLCLYHYNVTKTPYSLRRFYCLRYWKTV